MVGGLGVVLGTQADSILRSAPAFARPHRTGTPTAGRPAGYGALVADPAGRLDLPEGFHYRIVTKAGDPLEGGAVPGRPDGTATFWGRGGTTVMVQNHEQGSSADYPVVADADYTYDPGAFGGTTNITVDQRGRLIRQFASLGGTYSNCAGGRTPWGTWLTCEETEERADSAKGLTKDHGFVFEVHPTDLQANRVPQPLTALGRFPHEAAAVDPMSGIVLLTEDASSPNGLLYRFTPATRPSRLHSLRDGGRLEALYVSGVPDLSIFSKVGTTLSATWRQVPDPMATTTSVRKQFDYTEPTTGQVVAGPGGPVTRSRKFEGLWWGDGKGWIVASFARKNDGSASEHDGQVWSYDPTRQRLRLEVFFPVNQAPGSDQPDGPDNITVSPYGGLILAEDGEGLQHLLAVSASGQTTPLGRNRMQTADGGYSEFTGPVFSPDRRVLFANIQDQGYVFAITGPWQRLIG